MSYLNVSLVVVGGAAVLALLADGVAEDDALLEQEHLLLLALVVASGQVRHDHRLLDQQLALGCYVALEITTKRFF